MRKSILFKGISCVAGVILTLSMPMTALGAEITVIDATIPDGSYSGKSTTDDITGAIVNTTPGGLSCDLIVTTNSDGTWEIIAHGSWNMQTGDNDELSSSTTLNVNGKTATYVTHEPDPGFPSLINYIYRVNMTANSSVSIVSDDASDSSEVSDDVSDSSEVSDDVSDSSEASAEAAKKVAEEERRSSHFQVATSDGEALKSEIGGKFYYEYGAVVEKGDNEICKDKENYSVSTYIANENCQEKAYASLTGYASEGGFSVISATSFDIVDLANNPFSEYASWFEANENNTITGNAKNFNFSDGSTITTDKYTTAKVGLPQKADGKVIVVGVTKGGVVFTQEDQDDDPLTVTFDALMGDGVYGFMVKNN